MKFKKLFSGFLAAAMLFINAVPVKATENTVHLYSGDASAQAWSCPVTIPVPDTSIYTEGNTIAVQCETDEAPYFVLTSNSGGESWAQVLPDGAENDWYYYSYDAMSAVFGTDFSLLDYISVMAANSPVTVYAIDMLIGSEQNESNQEDVKHESRVVGYLPDWSYQSYGYLDFSALTHLNIAFCNPDTYGDLACYIPDYEMKNIVTKAHNSDVKVMAALGGGGGCDGYLPLLDTPQEMADFNEKIMAYCEQYDLDGIDLDIELGSSHEIWNYYADWVSSLRVLCDERGYELSTATAQWVAVNVTAETFALFDFVNVMAYDNELGESSHADMEFAQTSLQYFNVQKKIAKDKLVLGVPFYGRGYTSNGALDWNSYVAFSELIALDTANYDADLYNGIAYNGASTMREKCALAKEYGGIMIWELSQDASDEYSLLAVIKDELTVSSEIMGDVNADGKFDAYDIAMLGGYLVRTGDITDWQAGDLYNDSKLDAADLCIMKRMLITNSDEPNFSFDVSDNLFDQSNTDTLGLSYPTGLQTYTVWEADEESDHYCNGVCLAGFKDKLYCMWQSSATDEDSADTRVMYSISSDGGKTWTEPQQLVQDITVAGVAGDDTAYCSSGGWLATQDQLVAYINVWPGIEPRGGYTYYMATSNGTDWSSPAPVMMADGTQMNAIFEQDPHILENGRIVNAAHFQEGLIVCPIYTDDPNGITGWKKGDFTANGSGTTSTEMEPSLFVQSDGTIVMIFRDQNSSYTKLMSYSYDNGETWSEVLTSDMPDARTKQSAGNLSDGTAFMAGCPVSNSLRSPLVVTLSADGKTFDHAYLLRSNSSLPELVYEGKAKRLGFHYCKSLVYDSNLYVGYATNKEAVEISVVPEESLMQN